MVSPVERVWEGFLNLLYPEGIDCYLCGERIAEGHRYGVCSSCVGSFVFIGDKSCCRCGKLLDSGDICGDCRSFPHYFDRAFSLCLYQGKVKEWIYSFKYGNKPFLARPFARMMADRIRELGVAPLVDAVAAVPLHRKRIRQRGYNQSYLLAEVIARELGFRKPLRALARDRDTPPLSGLTRHQRMDCMEGAFRVVDNSCRGIKNVLLVDDIYTTGITVNQCAKILKRAGLGKVYVFTLASGKNI